MKIGYFPDGQGEFGCKERCREPVSLQNYHYEGKGRGPGWD